LVKGIYVRDYESLEYKYARIFGGRGGNTRSNIVNLLLDSSIPLNRMEVASKLDLASKHCLQQITKLVNYNILTVSDNSYNIAWYRISKEFKIEIYIKVIDFIKNDEFYQRATPKTFGLRFLLQYKKTNPLTY
jgi:hypothetical protein